MSFNEHRRPPHEHRFFVDSDTGDELCLCGKLKGEPEKKYRNRITVYRDQTYDSAFEAEYAAELTLKKRGGLIKNWERQVNIPLMAWGRTICHYKVDFKVYHNDGSVEYVETKGKWTPDARIKWKLFEAQTEATERGTVLTVELLKTRRR